MDKQTLSTRGRKGFRSYYRYPKADGRRTRNMADDTDNDLAVAATTVLSTLSDQIKRKPKRDKWVQPWIVQRPISGAYHALHGVFSRHLALHKNRCNLIKK